MRLDIFLYENNIFQSREKARRAILESAVCVNGNIVSKPSYNVNLQDKIEIVKDTNPYVGRGGLKFERAIKSFNLDLKGVKALDVGASTGGFTDCMLKNGAVSVCACDVGHGQLDEKLRKDDRVLSLEGTDIRELSTDPRKFGIDFKFDFASVDVSFISLTKLLPYVRNLMKPGSIIICLIKPQFELDNPKVGKKGVIKDPKIHKRVCENVKLFASTSGFEVIKIIDSPIEGGDGNREFLMLLKS